MQRYQFSSPSVPEKDEYPVLDSTSLIDNNKSNVSNANGHNGILNGGLSSAVLNTDRAKLFKKANSCGGAVREWYV